MKKWIVLLLLIGAAWFWLHKPAAEWRGMPAARDPVQSTANLPPAFPYGDYTITPLNRYEIKAVVLARERYRNDPAAKLASVDLALGWRPCPPPPSSTTSEPRKKTPRHPPFFIYADSAPFLIS